MRENEIFTVADCARLSQSTRDTLVYYDIIGLLSPASRKDNGYRFYSADQLALMELINVCRALEMPLAEVKELVENRTPDGIIELLDKQLERFDEKIASLGCKGKLLSHMQNTIRSVLQNGAGSADIKFFESEPIVLGGLISRDKKSDEGAILREFYHSCRAEYPDLDLNYPVGCIISEEKLKSGEYGLPDRYYLSAPSGTDERPAGMYAVGCVGNETGEREVLINRLANIISGSGYKICGPAYEDYPINGFSSADSSRYLTRIMIAVKKENEAEGIKTEEIKKDNPFDKIPFGDGWCTRCS